MYDYMRALHARFCREPELQKAREELDQVYREIKARLGQQDQETLLQLADLIEKVSGRPLPRVFGPRRAGDVDLSAADISKFCAQGYRPGVSLEEGLSRLWTQTEAQ